MIGKNLPAAMFLHNDITLLLVHGTHKVSGSKKHVKFSLKQMKVNVATFMTVVCIAAVRNC